MKNKDIFKIRQILEKWTNVEGVISYYIFKNIEMCDVLIDTLNKLKVIDILDYKLQKSDIIKKYSNGIKDDQYVIDNVNDFNKEMDILDYNFIKTSEILNNECNIVFYKIKKEELPKNISANDIREIYFMVE